MTFIKYNNEAVAVAMVQATNNKFGFPNAFADTYAAPVEGISGSRYIKYTDLQYEGIEKNIGNVTLPGPKEFVTDEEFMADMPEGD